MKPKLFTRVLEGLIEPYNSLDHGNFRKTDIWQKAEESGWTYVINYDTGFGSTKMLFVKLHTSGELSFGNILKQPNKRYNITENMEGWIRGLFRITSFIPQMRVINTLKYLKQHSDNPIKMLEQFIEDGSLIHTPEEVALLRQYVQNLN